jgi:hypothetical protein
MDQGIILGLGPVHEVNLDRKRSRVFLKVYYSVSLRDADVFVRKSGCVFKTC